MGPPRATVERGRASRRAGARGSAGSLSLEAVEPPSPKPCWYTNLTKNPEETLLLYAFSTPFAEISAIVTALFRPRQKEGCSFSAAEFPLRGPDMCEGMALLFVLSGGSPNYSHRSWAEIGLWLRQLFSIQLACMQKIHSPRDTATRPWLSSTTLCFNWSPFGSPRNPRPARLSRRGASVYNRTPS